MRLLVSLLCLLLFILGGCSFVDEESSNLSGPRLLSANGEITGLLSSRTANDWSPQMVTIANGSVTNRYLYFISDRDTPAGSSTKVYSIYRARHVQGMIFENLTLLYTNTNKMANLVVSTTNNSYSEPVIYVSVWNSGLKRYELKAVEYVSVSYSMGSAGAMVFTGDVFPMGSMRRFPANTDLIFLFDKALGLVKAYDVGSSTLSPSGAGEAFYPLARSLLKFKLGERAFTGGAPLRVKLNSGKMAFGFVVGYGESFYLTVNSNVADVEAWSTATEALSLLEYLTSSFFQGELVLPLFTVEHVAGTIDKNPSFDPETGLYFASNRDGVFDLYFVPKASFLPKNED